MSALAILFSGLSLLRFINCGQADSTTHQSQDYIQTSLKQNSPPTDYGPSQTLRQNGRDSEGSLFVPFNVDIESNQASTDRPEGITVPNGQSYEAYNSPIPLNASRDTFYPLSSTPSSQSFFGGQVEIEEHVYGGQVVPYNYEPVIYRRQPVKHNLGETDHSQGSTEVKKPGPPLIWHVGVYSKEYVPYLQICGGSLVTTKAVISAAHCFWSDLDGALPASQFAVGAGKLYRPWSDPNDIFSQRSDVSAIHIPSRFRGVATNFQEDIAVVLLKYRLRPSFAVRPVCVSFEDELDAKQLRKGEMGTIMGWGLTEENGLPSQVLNYLELPAVDIDECFMRSDRAFLKYITSDKICAGVTFGKAVCRGDSGGGLVFFDRSGSPPVPYLRGVASTAPRDENDCNAHALAALTHVLPHRAFLLRHIPDLEKECERHFPQGTVEDRFGNIMAATTTGRSVKRQKAKFVCNCYCNNATRQ